MSHRGVEVHLDLADTTSMKSTNPKESNMSFINELRAYTSDHAGHDLEFESQEYIVCCDCDETLILPEGTGVQVLESEIEYVLEVPSGIENGHVKYHVDPVYGSVEV